MELLIRKLEEHEYKILERFLYEAIFQRKDVEALPYDVIYEPTLFIYIKEFGKAHDNCLVAEHKGEIIGAVWTRILSEEPKGFGNIDDSTPEFAISILPELRGNGVGKKLMEEMIKLLKVKEYNKTSLAVQKDNYALKLYKDVGFEVIKEIEEEYIMICEL